MSNVQALPAGRFTDSLIANEQQRQLIEAQLIIEAIDADKPALEAPSYEAPSYDPTDSTTTKFDLSDSPLPPLRPSREEFCAIQLIYQEPSLDQTDRTINIDPTFAYGTFHGSANGTTKTPNIARGSARTTSPTSVIFNERRLTRRGDVRSHQPTSWVPASPAHSPAFSHF